MNKIVRLIFYVLCLCLVGCASDPMSEIPSNQRIMMMAQQQDKQGNSFPGQKLTVQQMLQKVRRQTNNISNTKGMDYYVTLQFDPKQKKLTQTQQEKLSKVVSKLSNPSSYLLLIRSGPGEFKQNIHSAYLSEHRMQMLNQQLGPVVGAIEQYYDPNVPAGFINLSFLYQNGQQIKKKPAPVVTA